MTGFNINCIDCEYCYRIEEYHHSSIITACHFCVITSEVVNIEQNIDCCDFVKRRKSELEILH